MSRLQYVSRYPRGNARNKANVAIRRGLPGGDALLDASKMLADAVRSSAGRGSYQAAAELLDSALTDIAARGSADLTVGVGQLHRCQAALRDYLAGINDANAGAAMGLMDMALDNLRDAATKRHARVQAGAAAG